MLPEDLKTQLPDGQILILRTVEEVSPTFYINNATFTFTQWDIRADLSEIQNIKQGGNPKELIALVVRKARIVMTVPYAKQFANVLLAHVAKHEAIQKQTPEEGPEAAPIGTTGAPPTTSE